MKRIRVRMLRTIGQLSVGREYNLPNDMVNRLAAEGAIKLPEERSWPRFTVQTVEPSETKPIEAVEPKSSGPKSARRSRRS